MKHEQQKGTPAHRTDPAGIEAHLHWAALSDMFSPHPAVEAYDPNKHLSEGYDWIEAGRPILFNELIREGNRIGAVDMGKGRDLFWDGKQWHVSEYGVFTEEWIFVTDYHGFPQGALFRRVRENQKKE